MFPEGRQVDPREVRARRDHPTVKLLLEKGYKWEVIKELISQRLRYVGTDYVNAADLLEAYYEFEDEETTSMLGGIKGAQTAAASPFALLAKVGGDQFGGAQDFVDGRLAPRQSARSLDSGFLDGNLTSGVHGSQLSAGSLGGKPEPGLSSTPRMIGEAAVFQAKLEEEKALLQETLAKLHCKDCKESLVAVTFLPCGHLVCCSPCATRKVNCIVCGIKIEGTVLTHIGENARN